MNKILLLCILFCLMSFLTISWGVDHNFGVSKNHNFLQKNRRINYTKILNFWTEHRKELILSGNRDEVVLVMGNTGSGKSTLISALIGRNLTVIKQKGYSVIIDEENRIGTGTSSKTLVPEVMIDYERNVTYVDCPGFRDNRDVEYEISSLYFQNILMNQIKKIKLILVINYDSLTINGNKNDFDDLLEHVSEFIKNMEKFHTGIALVVTKVENSYEEAEDGTIFLSDNDQLVIDGIADYLKNKQETYRNKTENVRKYRMYADLIDGLLQVNNNSYMKIGTFHKPTGKGSLLKMIRMQREMNVIANIITENLHYVAKQKNDFGFALSKALKISVEQIIDDIYRNALTKRLHKIGNETLVHYLQKEKKFHDIIILRKEMSHAYHLISLIHDFDKPEEVFEKFLNVTNTLNIPMSLTNLDIIVDDIKKLRFFTTVSDNAEEIHVMRLKNETQNIIHWIKEMKDFYDFLNDLKDKFDRYNSQPLRNDHRISDIIRTSSDSTHKIVGDIPELENVAKAVGSDEKYHEIKSVRFNQFRLIHLKAVLSAFIKKLECMCSPSLMIVNGYNVRLSDVVKVNCYTQAISMQVFALNKIFIDQTIDKTGAKAQLSMVAPIWEVIGGSKIILDGETGNHHDKMFADSASLHSQNGRNGLPGLPGGPAGNFLGVGEQFINSKYLEIHANGGNGGQGQNGGKGADGIPGEGLPPSFFKIDQEPNFVEKYLDEHQYKYTKFIGCPEGYYRFHGRLSSGCSAVDLEVTGKSAIKPTNGGHGGAGGRGGYPGRIIIYSVGKPINIRTLHDAGSNGSEGQGGYGGKETAEGVAVRFLYTGKNPWNFGGHNTVYPSIAWSTGAKIAAGENGLPGHNENGRIDQARTTPIIVHHVINSFKKFVRINLHKNIKESELVAFIHKIESDVQLKVQYNTHAFVDELKGLEDQFLKLKNKINFDIFYGSLLTRVKEYVKSEKNADHKKVLSYIYTAAFTKLITLNNKQLGQTVVNLPKYLETIQQDIKKINKFRYLQIVDKYRNDYKNTLMKKIQEANYFIQHTIEPEIDKLWEESDEEMIAVVNEINKFRESTKNTLETLERKRDEISSMMTIRTVLLPLKLACGFLSFLGPIGAGVGIAVTTLTTIAEASLLDKISELGENKIYSLDPNLKLVSRVTEVINNKYKLATEKVKDAIEKLDDIKEQSRISNDKKKEEIDSLKLRLQEVMTTKPKDFSELVQRTNNVKQISKKILLYTNSEIETLKKEQEEQEKITRDLSRDMRYEKKLRVWNDVQSLLTSTEIVFSFTRNMINQQGMIKKVNDQISECVHQIEVAEQMENQVYDMLLPSLEHVEETMNVVKNSLNGSSHVKLDLTKWKVQTTLKNVKSLLQKFTYKMSFELKQNLKRFIEKINEGFSILIDIYDRIDSYSDNIKQAEYVARIESASKNDFQLADAELSEAVNDLKLMIHSNILTEKYEIALRAFKQHYFPFAARQFLQKFEMPIDIQLNDTDTLTSNIVEKIEEMKNNIDESTATIGEYSRYIHRQKVFDSDSPFFTWKHDTINYEFQQLLNGSEMVVYADIHKGYFYNAVKFNNIGINFKFHNGNWQSRFMSVLKNFKLIMTMIGKNYYRCGEQYYSISFDDDVTISYTLKKDKNENWIDPNETYTLLHSSHAFLSPYGMWRIKLESVNESVSFDHLNVYANNEIDLELVGQGYYIEQDASFNFEVCNEDLETYYDVENIVKVLF